MNLETRRKRWARALGLHRRKRRYRKPEEAVLALVPGGVRTLFDVGAHVGDMALGFRKYFGDARIWCFEPFPESFGRLQANTAADGGIRAFPLALAAEKRTATFYGYGKSTANSLLARAEGAAQWSPPAATVQREAIQVECVTLDAFCREHAVARIDLLKIDAQGAELDVLRGAAGLLASRAIGCILAEVAFVPLYQGQGFFHDVAGLLQDRGYRLFDLFNARYSEAGQIKWADALFVPADAPA